MRLEEVLIILRGKYNFNSLRAGILNIGACVDAHRRCRTEMQTALRLLATAVVRRRQGY